MPSTPLNKTLYEQVKREASKKFLAPTSAYRSSWIVREYKKRGGKYKITSKTKEPTGLKRWYKEKWVDLNRPIKKGNKIIGYKTCGRSKASKKGSYPLCRPSKRITSKTPKTYKEISKKRINQVKSKKRSISYKGKIRF